MSKRKKQKTKMKIARKKRIHRKSAHCATVCYLFSVLCEMCELYCKHSSFHVWYFGSFVRCETMKMAYFWFEIVFHRMSCKMVCHFSTYRHKSDQFFVIYVAPFTKGRMYIFCSFLSFKLWWKYCTIFIFGDETKRIN